MLKQSFMLLQMMKAITELFKSRNV